MLILKKKKKKKKKKKINKLSLIYILSGWGRSSSYKLKHEKRPSESVGPKAQNCPR
jgi:hypothetical protein